jgi:hypothetical protein
MSVCMYVSYAIFSCFNLMLYCSQFTSQLLPFCVALKIGDMPDVGSLILILLHLLVLEAIHRALNNHNLYYLH